jgi:hypothetical protein
MSGTIVWNHQNARIVASISESSILGSRSNVRDWPSKYYKIRGKPSLLSVHGGTRWEALCMRPLQYSCYVHEEYIEVDASTQRKMERKVNYYKKRINEIQNVCCARKQTTISPSFSFVDPRICLFHSAMNVHLKKCSYTSLPIVFYSVVMHIYLQKHDWEEVNIPSLRPDWSSTANDDGPYGGRAKTRFFRTYSPTYIPPP